MLIGLFCRDGKDTKYFNHDLHNCVSHSRVLRERDFAIDVQSLEDVLFVFYAHKEAKEKFIFRLALTAFAV
jgi:hypothetical protein